MEAVRVAKGPFTRDYFVRMGRKGGKKSGGKAGRAKLAQRSAQERSDAARKAVQARWAKRKKGKG
jgi:hypothetical protein